MKKLLFLSLLTQLFVSAQIRTISHITSATGGFQTSIILENITDQDQSYRLEPFEIDGSPLVVVSGNIAAQEVLEVNSTVLFGSDKVSHFIVAQGDGIVVRASYQVLSGRGSPAHVAESNVQDNEWRVYAGNWSSIFDGVAFVNMGSASTDIVIEQISFTGELLASKIGSESLAPMAKGLYLLGGSGVTNFEFRPDAYFVVKASQPIAITALRGTQPGSPVGYLWENEPGNSVSLAGEKRVVSHVTKTGGGFTTRVIIENMANSNQNFSLQPYALDGTVLTVFSGSLTAFEVKAFDVETLFGDDTGHISHFYVTNTSGLVHCSVTYQIASGPGSPASVRESPTQKTLWRAFSGNWDEVFDGFAVVNTGDQPTDILVKQLDGSGNTLRCQIVSQNLQPNAKALFVIGGPNGSTFSNHEGSFFEISGTEALAITLLRGTVPGADVGYLWKNGAGAISDDLAEVHGLNTCFGTGSCIVAGYIMSGSPLIFIDDPDNAPQGYAPVANADIRALNNYSEVVGNATTDENGYFSIEGLPWGHIHLEAREYASSSEPDVTTKMTSIPDATILTNKVYSFSREEAIALVLAQAPETAMVMATMQPLMPGSIVYEAGPHENGEWISLPVSRLVLDSEWLFFVDYFPLAVFSHDVAYVFVHTDTGEITWVNDVMWPPAINFQQFWFSEHERFDFNERFGIDDLEPPEEIEPSAEIVQMPKLKIQPQQEFSFKSSVLLDHNTDPESIFVIAWKAGAEAYKTTNVNKFTGLFKAAGVPDSNIKIVSSQKDGKVKIANSGYMTSLLAFNDIIKDRLTHGLHSTLFVYVTSHGSGSNFGTYPSLETGWYEGISAAKLNLTSTKACRVRFFAEFCWARNFTDALAAIFDAQPEEERHDYIFYAPCRGDEVSFSIPIWLSYMFNGIPDIGAMFTSEMLGYATVENGDVTGLLNEDGDDIRPELSWIVGTPNPLEQNMIQHPSAIVRPNDPVFCRDTDESFIQIDPPPGTSFEGYWGRECEPCFQVVGTVTITNPSGTSELEYEVTTDSNEVGLTSASGTLPPGGQITVDVTSDCTQDLPSSVGITVTGTNPHGDTEEHEVTLNLSNGLSPAALRIFRGFFPDKTIQEIQQLIAPWVHLWDILLATTNTFGRTRVPDCNTDIEQHAAHIAALALATGGGKKDDFPCGQGDYGFTVCPNDQLPQEDGDYIIIHYATMGPIALNDPAWHFQLGFVFDSDGNPNNNYVPSYENDTYRDTDRWYSTEYTPSQGWKLKVTDARNNNFQSIASAARVIINENAVTLLVPRSEFDVPNPTFRITAYTHQGDWGRSNTWSGDVHPALDAPLLEINE